MALEALKCFTDAFPRANTQQLYEFVNKGAIELFIDLLGRQSSGYLIINSCLEALEEILKHFENQPNFESLTKGGIVKKIVECNGIEVIKKRIPTYKSKDLSDRAEQLLKNHLTNK